MVRRRYELTDKEWLITMRLLPKSREAFRGLTTVVSRTAFSGAFTQVHPEPNPRAYWLIDDVLQSVRPREESRRMGPVVGGGCRRVQRRIGDDQFYLYARLLAWCDG